jgi:hypothetical protein
MRRLILVLVASVGLLGFASVAGANSVAMIWTGTTGTGATGTSDINVSNTLAETLTLTLTLQADSTGVGAYFISLRFDTDGANELNILSWTEGSWTNGLTGAKARTMTSLNAGIESTQESQNVAPEGRLFTFEANSLGTGIKNASMIWGVVVFVTNPANVSTDGDDIFSGLFNPGVDGMYNNANLNIAGTGAMNAQASVNTVAVPEPGIVALLGVGVGALLLAGRRRSR